MENLHKPREAISFCAALAPDVAFENCSSAFAKNTVVSQSTHGFTFVVCVWGGGGGGNERR